MPGTHEELTQQLAEGVFANYLQSDQMTPRLGLAILAGRGGEILGVTFSCWWQQAGCNQHPLSLPAFFCLRTCCLLLVNRSWNKGTTDRTPNESKKLRFEWTLSSLGRAQDLSQCFPSPHQKAPCPPVPAAGQDLVPSLACSSFPPPQQPLRISHQARLTSRTPLF